MQKFTVLKSILLITCLLVDIATNAQVGIGTLNPASSAELDINSTTRGFLAPRMTGVQRDAIIAPATGLLIFCTDNNLYFSNQGTSVAPNWKPVNSKWFSSGSAIYFNGGNVGIGTSNPSTVLDIAGGNNWDIINGNGDVRIGNSLYRLKIGLALDGGGAGAVGIMQHGQPGGYNVLAIGAQGHQILFINGNSQRVGIGTDGPVAALDVRGSMSVIDGTQGAGKVLTSDANGLTTWAIANTHYIGESYGGGIVFYVYDNGRHGLIASVADQSAGVRWYAGTYTNTMSKAAGVGAGKANTAIIVGNQGYGDGANYAARLCNEYSVTVNGVTYGDWYLPSMHELRLLFPQTAIVGGFASDYYWTSSEVATMYIDMKYMAPNTGGEGLSRKDQILPVRAIRAF